MYKCNHCETKVKKEDVFCKKCGKNIENSKIEESSKKIDFSFLKKINFDFLKKVNFDFLKKINFDFLKKINFDFLKKINFDFLKKINFDFLKKINFDFLKKINFKNLKELSKKQLIIIASSVIAVLLMIVLLIVLFSKNTTVSAKPDYTIEAVKTPKGDYLSIGNEATLVEGGITSISHSSNLEKAAVLTKEGKLFYYDKNGIKLVAINVDALVISADGSNIAYIPNCFDSSGTIYLYDSEKQGTATKISEGATCRSDKILLSPNGEQLSYYLKSEEKFVYFDKDDFTSFKLEKKFKPLALANNLEYVYAVVKTANERSICVVKDGTLNIIATFDINLNKVYFNEDHSEIVFRTDRGLFRSIDGGAAEPLKLSPNDIEAVGLTEIKEIRNALHGVYDTVRYNYASVEQSMLNDYFKTIIYFFNENGSGLNEIDYDRQAKITEDGNTVYYIKNNNLMKATNLRSNDISKILLTNDVTEFTIADEGAIYFINGKGDLYFNNGENNLLIGNSIEQYIIGLQNQEAYYLKDGTLYYSKAGNIGSVVSDKSIKTISNQYNSINFVEEGTNDVYSGSEKTFTLLIDAE